MQAIIKVQTKTIKDWAATPEIVTAVREQNARGVSSEEIKKIDQEWISNGQQKLAVRLQNNTAGTFLYDK